MKFHLLKFSIIILACFASLSCNAFVGTVKFSNDFYAAQKYFYNEAKKKFPKITADKFYPEVPVCGTATNEELKNISPLTDLFEARQKITDEAGKYPEQVYTEAFAFLYSHPGLNESFSNKPKFEALEKYFFPFLHLFSSDKHYTYNPELKTVACPVVFCLKDEKKNSISFKITNNSKKNFSFNLNETFTQKYFTLSGSKPVNVKAGQTATIKLTVNINELKKDSAFKLFNFVFNDPTQPRIKLLVPVILLPSKDLLSLPAHFFDIKFIYSTFFKNIDLYKDRTSGPVPCPNNNCSGERNYVLRSPDRLGTMYDFGDLCTIQYNFTTSSDPFYNTKNSSFKFAYNELGNLEGKDRNCPGVLPGSSAPCPPETQNNGKQIYGVRKIEFKAYLPPGKNYRLKINLRYLDLLNQPGLSSELSWLQDKKLMVMLTDDHKKEIVKTFVSGMHIDLDKADLPPGIYTLSVFPTHENASKTVPAFDIQHVNHAGKSRFDFTLNGSAAIWGMQVPVKK